MLILVHSLEHAFLCNGYCGMVGYHVLFVNHDTPRPQAQHGLGTHYSFDFGHMMTITSRGMMRGIRKRRPLSTANNCSNGLGSRAINLDV